MKSAITLNVDPATWSEALKSYAKENGYCAAWRAAGTLRSMGCISEALLTVARKVLQSGMDSEIHTMLHKEV